MNTDFDDFRGKQQVSQIQDVQLEKKTNFRHIFQLTERDFNCNLLQTLLETNKPTDILTDHSWLWPS